jgi:catechol 2,3-dioxygenase-like lactoylglutathione lyase family enzyme
MLRESGKMPEDEERHGARGLLLRAWRLCGGADPTCPDEAIIWKSILNVSSSMALCLSLFSFGCSTVGSNTTSTTSQQLVVEVANPPPAPKEVANPPPAPKQRPFASATMLVVSDIARSLNFYVKLGFVEPATSGEPPGVAMMHRDGFGFDLMLSLGTPPSNGDDCAWDRHLRIVDLAAEEEALRAAGVAIDGGPVTTEDGMYEISVVDPDGHRVCFDQEERGY